MIKSSYALRLGWFFLPFLSVLVYIFLYLPIAILMIFSCNQSELPSVWGGFSSRWYQELLHSPEIWNALVNSLIVAACAVTLSLTMGVLYVFYGTQKIVQRLYVTFFAGLATPEIVIGVGLLSLFSLLSIPLGLTTLIAGHTLIGLGYVIPILYARYEELDKQYMEASLDLGATQAQTLRYVMIPLLRPALLAAGLIVFVISLDDFIISFFCSGGATQTLPIYIFVMIRSGATPVVNALSTVLLLLSSILVLIFSSLSIKRMELLR